jgi:hypothetical protein
VDHALLDLREHDCADQDLPSHVVPARSPARRGLLTLASPGDASLYEALPRVHRGQRSAAELLDEERGSR